ncbi:MAG: single-stranded-DNA-specific exonuclease RecJ [Firmicutes bacterium]|uniref:single-stranded-DNA-specific exonuclease RecJ n=1 Tax=Lentihominibacter sp. TaxID=2944216 RepID=UPI002A588724|nr:single-stranded-DNA-specific exonuclease RecJ [Lentihominibacter sp.]MCI5853380.1 single-stranded-DNA-specific exonuclease RecJ [Clostridiales bacterium]MDD7320113.1 single-stranded-DNA-specific exonuclease RecJ [Bacillota bacterium]MDY5286461.1 single-stranded-DNA-specific exonuclease RecJ [Lentihominibacter sp.]
MRKTEEILRTLLHQKGIDTQEDISEFLSDRPQKTYDPFLLYNMEAGVDLLLSEIKKNTKICIYGDYDADGVTSVCILSSVLSHLTSNFIHYIPSRVEEGYGLNKNAVRKLADQGVGLIVTVDCGSVSCEEADLARELGMKMIVTDHHSIDGKKADCIVINPKQKEDSYPFDGIAGCGVAFKLCQALQKRTGLPKSVLNEVLDLLAVGTVADVVPLLDENRTFVKYGLARINAGTRPAMKSLKEGISLKNVASENIAFGIGPHINAAGRMAEAEEAVQLFISRDPQTIHRQVEKLIHYNTDRKQKQEDAYKRGLAILEEEGREEDFIVLPMTDIHEGVGGIVAGKIKEEKNRPIVIVTPSGEGFLKGTGRSIDPVDIYAVLKKCDDTYGLFERFGGHRSACGFLMAEEKLSLLRQAVQEQMDVLKAEDPHIFDSNVTWDLELDPAEVTVDLAETLDQLEPFGKDNERPKFLLRDVTLQGVRFMGADETHARFTAVSQAGARADCVLFRKAQEWRSLLCSEEQVDLIGSIDVQQWQGRTRVQLMIEEMKAWN